MASTTEYNALPEAAKSTARSLARLGFTEGRWVYDDNAELGDPGKNIQVRDQEAQANPSDVSNYAAAMKLQKRNSSEFPPRVMTRDGYLIDGVTRTTAADRVGWQYFPSFFLDLSWEDAPDSLKDQYIYLGGALNLSHGRGLSKANKARLILTLLASDPDASPQDIFSRLGGGLTKGFVVNVISGEKARKRAARLGVEMGHLSSSHQAHFGQKSSKFNDAVWQRMIEVARDGQVPVQEIAALTRRIEDLGTDEQKLAELNRELSLRQMHGAEKMGGTRPPLAAQLRRALGMVLKHADNPTVFVETSTATADAHQRVLTDSVETLNKVLAAQRNLSRDRFLPTR